MFISSGMDMSEYMPADMVETERFFPVKGETPMCSEIRVFII